MMVSDREDDDRRHSLSRYIKAAPQTVYDAFLRPEDLVRWMPPQGAVGRIDTFEPWQDGRLRLVLTFATAPGKASANSDIVDARFVRLEPGERIVLAVDFASDRPEFAGTMTMTWTFIEEGDGTTVSIVADNVPAGISRSDHEIGMASTLANLAAFVERQT